MTEMDVADGDSIRLTMQDGSIVELSCAVRSCGSCRVSIDAPRHVSVRRGEVESLWSRADLRGVSLRRNRE